MVLVKMENADAYLGKVRFYKCTKAIFKHDFEQPVLIFKWTLGVFLFLPQTVAVVTVPVYFNDPQRQATKDAGTMLRPWPKAETRR